MTRDVLTMEGRFDWGRYDFGTFRRRDVLTMGRFDRKANVPSLTTSLTKKMAALNGEACVETCFGVKIQHSLSRKV